MHSVGTVGTVDVAFTEALEFDGSNNPNYIGLAPSGTAKSAPFWLIKKLTFDVSNNVTDIKLANGVAKFENIWDNRAALSYS